MDKTALRAKLARIAKDMRAVVDGAKSEGRDTLTQDEQAVYDSHKSDYEATNKQLENIEELESIEAEVNQVEPAVSEPKQNSIPVGPAAKREFESFGEFVHAIRYNPNDQRLNWQENPVRGEQSVGTPSEGGFMVPKQFKDTLLSVDTAEAIVRPRAQVLPAGSPPDAAISIPALDQGSTENMYGGIVVDWIAEGDTKPETDLAVREVELKPNEVAGHTVITDKLLRNWQASDALITSQFRKAIVAAEDDKFLNGLGNGTPLGALASQNGARITQIRNTANDVKWVDITNMFGKIKMGGNLVFACNQRVLPKLMTLEDGNGNNMWMPSGRDGTPMTLAGYPLVINPRMPSLGSTGDLALLDLGYYLIKDGSGPFFSMSEHVHFLKNKTVIKAFWNVDGAPWMVEPITDEDSNTYSPFVLLDAATS